MHTFICSPFSNLLRISRPLRSYMYNYCKLSHFAQTTKGKRKWKLKQMSALKWPLFSCIHDKRSSLLFMSEQRQASFAKLLSKVLSSFLIIIGSERQCSFVRHTPTAEGECIKLLSTMMFKISPAIIMNSVNLCRTLEYLQININREGKRYRSWLPSGNVVELI